MKNIKKVILSMDIYDNAILINSAEIIDIVRRSLSKIDPRLIDHGERVGYIAGKIYKACKKKPILIFLS